MFIHRRRGWEIPERLATPEALVIGRRAAVGGVAAAGLHRSASRGLRRRSGNCSGLARSRPRPWR